jgi:hypothetical protein
MRGGYSASPAGAGLRGGSNLAIGGGNAATLRSGALRTGAPLAVHNGVIRVNGARGLHALRHGLRGRVPIFIGSGLYPYDYYYDDYGCYESQLVLTPYGYRWARIWVCS